MMGSWLILGLVASILLLLTFALNMAWTAVRLRRTDNRVQRTIAVGTPGETRFAGIFSLLQSLGEWLRRFYAPSSLEHLRSMIGVSGFNPHRTLPMLLGAKLVVMLLIFAIAGFAAYFTEAFQVRLLILGAGVILGILGPEWILAIVRRRFAATIERGTPDALDLLVVCSEAGMGLESALERVSSEMQHSNKAIAGILAGLLDDLRVVPSRREAFINLGTRSGAEGMRRMGTMLIQSMQHGTPLGQALRAIAEELRRDRMNKLEEKAVKLPAKLIFPMIGFIMPSLYIVLLGPSFIPLYDSLANFTGNL